MEKQKQKKPEGCKEMERHEDKAEETDRNMAEKVPNRQNE